MRPSRQSGVALIAMLILATIILVTMGGIFYRHRLDMSSARRVLVGEQATLLALSGEHWVTNLLQQDRNNSDIDSLKENWAQRIPSLPVEGGTLTGCVVDLQGRFNINDLSGYTSERWSHDLRNISSSFVDTYLNLLASAGLPSDDSRAAVVVDWIDPDAKLIASGSAEDPEYMQMTPPHLAANQMLTSIDELAGLAGYSAADMVKLRPYLSVLPHVTRINVNTASADVLAALMPFVNGGVIKAILDQRPFESVADFQSFVASNTGYMSQGEVASQVPDSLIDVRSQFYELIADVNIGGTRLRLRSDMYRPAAGGEVETFRRNLQVLPTVELPRGMQHLMDNPCPPLEQANAP